MHLRNPRLSLTNGSCERLLLEQSLSRVFGSHLPLGWGWPLSQPCSQQTSYYTALFYSYQCYFQALIIIAQGTISPHFLLLIFQRSSLSQMRVGPLVRARPPCFIGYAAVLHGRYTKRFSSFHCPLILILDPLAYCTLFWCSRQLMP